MRLGVFAAALLLAGCEDPNRFTAADKARLIDNHQASMDQLNEADAIIRALDSPRSKLGRQHRREAAERNQRLQNVMDTLQNLQVRE